MTEGGLGAPTRHPIAWREPDYYDPALLDAELRRVFDICHGCRRCFSLCNAFPTLFDAVDESDTGELDGAVTQVIEENPDAPGKYGVRGIPTMILFKNGQPAATKVGAEPKSQLKAWLQGEL